MGNDRYKFNVSPKFGVLVFKLEFDLIEHARNRMRYFFRYALMVRLAINYIAAMHYPIRATYRDVVVGDATHQYGKGDKAGITPYQNKDPNIILQKTCEIYPVDATHMNNLGVVEDFYEALIKDTSGDKNLKVLANSFATYCGDTILLPKRINIGPDKIMDKLHTEIIQLIVMRGGPIITNDNFRFFAQEAVSRLNAYRQKQFSKGNLGVVACIDCYINIYKNITDVDNQYRWIHEQSIFDLQEFCRNWWIQSNGSQNPVPEGWIERHIAEYVA